MYLFIDLFFFNFFILLKINDRYSSVKTAIVNGHKDVAIWLMENTNAIITYDAMVAAIENGGMDEIVEFGIQKENCEKDISVMEMAIKMNNIKMVKFLKENGFDYSDSCIFTCIKNNYVELLKIILNTDLEICRELDDGGLDTFFISSAIKYERYECLELLENAGDFVINSSEVVEEVLENNEKVDGFLFLLRNKPEAINIKFIQGVINHKNLSWLQLMWEHKRVLMRENTKK